MHIKPGDKVRIKPLTVFELQGRHGAIIVRWLNGPLMSIGSEDIEEVIPAPRQPLCVGDLAKRETDGLLMRILAMDQETAWCSDVYRRYWSLRTDELIRSD